MDSIYNIGYRIKCSVLGYIKQFCKNTERFDLNVFNTKNHKMSGVDGSFILCNN